ncbi:acyl-CoA dehydrogenase [Rhodococcus rhodnii LMG 5362]|uniref:Acyl-CoA dehydrogenase n=1 Tax=Rhodococcus rhodnii LMG 5362 TaxID=1273125 RepID=R7WNS3_9NOCA|nr:acyl-CoA dehydrogenase [Rhodococcus rhodnii LMG 5362]
MSATAFVTEAAVARAAQAVGAAIDAAADRGAVDVRLENAAALAAAKVKVAVEEPALRAAAQLFEVGGASATRAGNAHDRHWRNLRTLFSHNPTLYKSRALGEVAVNGTDLPESGFF